jgi:hypothetical protein
MLVAGGGCVDLELVARRIAGGVELPSVDAPAVAVLALALPDDRKVSAGVHRRSGVHLIAGSGLVDLELRTNLVAR